MYVRSHAILAATLTYSSSTPFGTLGVYMLAQSRNLTLEERQRRSSRVFVFRSPLTENYKITRQAPRNEGVCIILKMLCFDLFIIYTGMCLWFRPIWAPVCTLRYEVRAPAGVTKQREGGELQSSKCGTLFLSCPFVAPADVPNSLLKGADSPPDEMGWQHIHQPAIHRKRSTHEEFFYSCNTSK